VKVLVIAPHADDETLGLGGTIARYVDEGHAVTVAILTGPGEGRHPIIPNESWDLVRLEARRAMTVLGVTDLIFENLPAVLVADQPHWELNRLTSSVLERVEPDVLFVPFLLDVHRDHRELFHSLSVAWRPSNTCGRAIKQIYTYEVVSETHWNFASVEGGFLPNVYIDISGYLDKKLEALACYESQVRPEPDSRSEAAVRALAVWRGSQMNMAAAESFVLVRYLVP